MTVHNAWIRSAPPNAKVLAAYMTIKNASTETRALTAVSSALFNKVEIHRTEMHEGMAKMIPQKELIIHAGESVSLETGGYHLMLMDPASVPKEGEQVDMDLRFDDGLILNIKVPVRSGSVEGDKTDNHHH
ncbi:MAG: copper chaperone PCu(A)C [Nitrospirae bacterium]|nr:copper chaperone PCu(A)C [Nitrospirota bacterium]